MYVGADRDKVVVSPNPIKLRSGRARRHTHGSWTELIPVRPSGRSRDERVRTASQVALTLLILGALITGLGIPWYVVSAAATATVGWLVAHQSRAARTAIFAPPRGEGSHVLHSARERTAYVRALETARRVRATWPALQHMIDPAEADRALTAALHDLAAVLARRQELRRLRDELAGAARHDLPADSPAVLAWHAQQQRAEQLWTESRDHANHILAGIDAAARAGENLIREQRLHTTARAAELAISRLTAATPPPSTAAPELAERTAAVIAAYRELSAGS